VLLIIDKSASAVGVRRPSSALIKLELKHLLQELARKCIDEAQGVVPVSETQTLLSYT
jgi:hypothetical protein